jgi:hypothetical protein
MKELAPTWNRVIRIWWAFTWRYVVIGWGLTILAFLVYTLLGFDIEERPIVGLGAALLATGIQIGAQVWALRQTINTDFEGFRIALSETFLDSQMRELTDSDGAV